MCSLEISTRISDLNAASKCITYNQTESIVNNGPVSLKAFLKHRVTFAKGRLVNNCDFNFDVISLDLGKSINGKKLGYTTTLKNGKEILNMKGLLIIFLVII